jgi:phosphatidylserine/phosphatidylglycerophosphate/cardiolipin synthase-like enzyme
VGLPKKVLILTKKYQLKHRPLKKHFPKFVLTFLGVCLDISAIHQKFAIFDRRIVWYGSINLLGYGRSEETLMCLESAGIAGELLKSLKIQ